MDASNVCNVENNSVGCGGRNNYQPASTRAVRRPISDVLVRVTLLTSAGRVSAANGTKRTNWASRLMSVDWGLAEGSAERQTGAFNPSVWTGRALQAESEKMEGLVLRICIRPLHGAFVHLAIMDIRAHPISFSERP